VLLLALLLPSVAKICIFIDFKINQSFIAAELCENRAKPTSGCNGHCYLAKKLRKQEKKEHEQVPESLKEKSEILFVLEFDQAFAVPLFVESKNKPSAQAWFPRSGSWDQVFRPPQNS